MLIANVESFAECLPERLEVAVGVDGYGYVAAGGDILGVNTPDAIGMGQVPFVARLARRQTGFVQLRAHRPVSEEHTSLHRFHKWFTHDDAHPEYPKKTALLGTVMLCRSTQLVKASHRRVVAVLSCRKQTR